MKFSGKDEKVIGKTQALQAYRSAHQLYHQGSYQLAISKLDSPFEYFNHKKSTLHIIWGAGLLGMSYMALANYEQASQYFGIVVKNAKNQQELAKGLYYKALADYKNGAEDEKLKAIQDQKQAQQLFLKLSKNKPSSQSWDLWEAKSNLLLGQWLRIEEGYEEHAYHSIRCAFLFFSSNPAWMQIFTPLDIAFLFFHVNNYHEAQLYLGQLRDFYLEKHLVEPSVLAAQLQTIALYTEDKAKEVKKADRLIISGQNPLTKLLGQWVSQETIDPHLLYRTLKSEKAGMFLLKAFFKKPDIILYTDFLGYSESNHNEKVLKRMTSPTSHYLELTYIIFDVEDIFQLAYALKKAKNLQFKLNIKLSPRYKAKENILEFPLATLKIQNALQILLLYLSQQKGLIHFKVENISRIFNRLLVCKVLDASSPPELTIQSCQTNNDFDAELLFKYLTKIKKLTLKFRFSENTSAISLRLLTQALPTSQSLTTLRLMDTQIDDKETSYLLANEIVAHPSLETLMLHNSHERYLDEFTEKLCQRSSLTHIEINFTCKKSDLNLMVARFSQLVALNISSLCTVKIGITLTEEIHENPFFIDLTSIFAAFKTNSTIINWEFKLLNVPLEIGLQVKKMNKDIQKKIRNNQKKWTNAVCKELLTKFPNAIVMSCILPYCFDRFVPPAAGTESKLSLADSVRNTLIPPPRNSVPVKKSQERVVSESLSSSL